jgi:hypothetical protein
MDMAFCMNLNTWNHAQREKKSLFVKSTPGTAETFAIQFYYSCIDYSNHFLLTESSPTPRSMQANGPGRGWSGVTNSM